MRLVAHCPKIQVGAKEWIDEKFVRVESGQGPTRGYLRVLRVLVLVVVGTIIIPWPLHVIGVAASILQFFA